MVDSSFLCLIYLEILRIGECWFIILMVSKKRWLCWDWVMFLKFMEVKDRVDVG